jgi:hypothetical protein
MSLPSKAHLNLCKIVEGSQEDLVVDALIVWQVAILYVSRVSVN